MKSCSTCKFNGLACQNKPMHVALNCAFYDSGLKTGNIDSAYFLGGTAVTGERPVLGSLADLATQDDAKPGGSTPSQYAIPDTAKELQDLIEYRDMNFARGNIFKAIYRMDVKHESPEYDLRKIIFFAERELKRLGFEAAKEG